MIYLIIRLIYNTINGKDGHTMNFSEIVKFFGGTYYNSASQTRQPNYDLRKTYRENIRENPQIKHYHRALQRFCKQGAIEFDETTYSGTVCALLMNV
jgi:hypothetical protein